MPKHFLTGLLLAVASCVHAAEFPEGAAVPTADEFRQRLGDRTFGVMLANGTTWRIEFKSNGYFFVDTSTGFRGTGEWRPERGRVCTRLRGAEESCNEGRVHEDHLHFKRNDGEVIRYVPR